MRLFDSHCHLDVDEFAGDRDAVLARARTAGIAAQLIPAIDRAHWSGLAQLCAQHTDLHPAYGIHPLYLDGDVEADLVALPDWIERHGAVAVGECGLDWFVEGVDPERQRRVFRRQLEIAREFDLPLVLHARRAVEEIILSLREFAPLRGVVHSYPGSEEQAAQLAKLGFRLGIGGPLTFERAHRLRRLVARVPLDWLLLETDAPDQPCACHRGQRNEPAHLNVVLRALAELRPESEERLAEATWQNACALFGLPSA